MACGATATETLRGDKTPLHLAVESGSVEAVQLVIRHGAWVNVRKSNGETALFEATAAGRIDIVKALLQHGAEPGLQNNRGKKPTEQASSQELVELLQGPKRRIESRAASSQPSAQRLAANPASTRSRAQALEHNTQSVGTGNDLEPPIHLICPLTKALFEDPVVAADGITYSRAAIEEWFRGHDTSPTTRARLESKILYPRNQKHLAVSRWLGTKAASRES
ncbi:g9976 [Coccomyxa viridis]|uniref:G9976 protein n=1 Tax=Coccomyxa viridis TaxID=1274662 RepID=A0ABP1G6W6_9CHLO